MHLLWLAELCTLFQLCGPQPNYLNRPHSTLQQSSMLVCVSSPSVFSFFLSSQTNRVVCVGNRGDEAWTQTKLSGRVLEFEKTRGVAKVMSTAWLHGWFPRQTDRQTDGWTLTLLSTAPVKTAMLVVCFTWVSATRHIWFPECTRCQQELNGTCARWAPEKMTGIVTVTCLGGFWAHSKSYFTYCKMWKWKKQNIKLTTKEKIFHLYVPLQKPPGRDSVTISIWVSMKVILVSNVNGAKPTRWERYRMKIIPLWSIL